jgi:hypothetical protein
MDSAPDDEQALERSREAFIAGIKTRLERAQASGQSPEQIQELVGSYAKEETRRQIPVVAARARAWWSGLRNFLIIGVLALGFAIGLALVIEHRNAAPLCEQYAAQHAGLRYEGIDYPVIGSSSSTTAPPRCIFLDAAGHRDTVSLDELQPNPGIALLVSFALQLSFMTPVAFILIALIAVSLRRSTTRLN